MLWPKHKRPSPRSLPFRSSKRRRKDSIEEAMAQHESARSNSTSSSTNHKMQHATLFSLPAELRNKIYDWVFDDDETIEISTLSTTVQHWVHLPNAPRNQHLFFPRRLVQIPPSLQDEALAECYLRSRFRVTSMQQLVQLYGMIGPIGLANLRNLEIDWEATIDVNRPLPDEDEVAMQALALLPRFEGLKRLRVTFNGFAFMLAYARYKHRRLTPSTSTKDETAASPRPGSSSSTTPASIVDISSPTASSHSKVEFAGHTIKWMAIPPKDDVNPGQSVYGYAIWNNRPCSMWKVNSYGAWAYPLRCEIAETDPLLVKLREAVVTHGGLETLELHSPQRLGETFLMDVVVWLTERLPGWVGLDVWDVREMRYKKKL